MTTTATITPTGVAREFGKDELIVTKTDLKGRILYANRLFVELSGYPEDEVVGRPHSMVRHPDMPRCIFELLWRSIQAGEEIFAYVKNLSANGDHYWVFAHVTPSYDDHGEVVGYHSNRRSPDAAALAKVEELYAKLLEAEARENTALAAVSAGARRLAEEVAAYGKPYEEMVHEL